jgi:hypothetical protein
MALLKSASRLWFSCSSAVGDILDGGVKRCGLKVDCNRRARCSQLISGSLNNGEKAKLMERAVGNLGQERAPLRRADQSRPFVYAEATSVATDMNECQVLEISSVMSQLAVHQLAAVIRCAPTTTYSETPDTLHTFRLDSRDSLLSDLATHHAIPPPTCLHRLSRI